MTAAGAWKEHGQSFPPTPAGDIKSTRGQGPGGVRNEIMRLRDGWRPWASQRVAKCGRVRIAENVGIATRDGRAHYHGLMRCASAWECPHCQTVLRIERADEVRRVVEWHAAAHGRENVSLLTLTVRHGMGDDLKTIRRGLTRAYQRVQTGQVWKRWKQRLGVVGYFRALETTHGANGWHPHIHAVLLTAVPPPAEFTHWLKQRWERIVTRTLGEEHAPTYDRGVDVRPCHAADYLSKLGLEITAPSKHGRGSSRTPLQILADGVAGCARSRALYERYAGDMKGARMLTWAVGLKDAAGVTERSDVEVIEGEDDAETDVAEIRGEAWDAVRDEPGVKLALLEGAEIAGAAGVRSVLAQFISWPGWYDPLGKGKPNEQFDQRARSPSPGSPPGPSVCGGHDAGGNRPGVVTRARRDRGGAGASAVLSGRRHGHRTRGAAGPSRDVFGQSTP